MFTGMSTIAFGQQEWRSSLFRYCTSSRGLFDLSRFRIPVDYHVPCVFDGPKRSKQNA
jgi:hypothetical protein